MAADLCRTYRNILVIGAEIMSRVVRFDTESKDVAILFGDGAGACVVSSETGFATIQDSVLASDGELASALELGTDSPLKMDGRTIILQAARKLPSIIRQLAERNNVALEDVQAFILHQANRNLILRVGQSLGVEEQKLFQNVNLYGNTSSASLLIAACEWWRNQPAVFDGPVVLAAFGAGLNWGAVLVRPRLKA
jgi:3-oxoacyl-[acyl-carrier-protein] synthase-3